MSKARRPPEPPPAPQLSATELKRSIEKINRRILELENFDVSAVTERSDPRAKTLETKANATIREIFGDGTVEYKEHRTWDLQSLPMIMGRRWSAAEVQEGYRKGIQRAIVRLNGTREILEEQLKDLTDDTDDTEATRPQALPSFDPANRRVFVVHGHDDGAKEAVARLLAKLGFEPIVLHEQPNQGRTVIEKFEHNSDVGFAVILMTPDDIGYQKDTPQNAKSRARQNVVLELGYFVGALGRRQVMVLYKGDVEMPSDYVGVVYEPLDERGGWMVQLAKELRAVGYNVDMNRL